MTRDDTRETKWDKKELPTRRPLSEAERSAIWRYYEEALQIGKTSDDLLEELSQRYGKSPRQIQRYIEEKRRLCGQLPRLKMGHPSVKDWAEDSQRGPWARYATLQVAAEGGMARICHAVGTVTNRAITLPLHWASTPVTPEEFSAPTINIDPRMPARLDVAFALPPPGLKPPRGAFTSGQIVTMVFPAEPQDSARHENERQVLRGCFICQPLALFKGIRRQLTPSLHAYLPPGAYHIRLEVTCDNGRGDTKELMLISPPDWEGLELKSVAVP